MQPKLFHELRLGERSVRVTSYGASVRKLTSFAGVELPHTAAPHSLTVRAVRIPTRVALVETHEIPSPASSVTKLGIVRFVISEEPTIPNGAVELPSFSDEVTSRPTVQMPPLADERDPPASIDEAFDRSSDEPAPEVSRRERTSTLLGVVPFHAAPRASSPEIPIPVCEHPEPIREEPKIVVRRPASSWWHTAFAGAAL